MKVFLHLIGACLLPATAAFSSEESTSSEGATSVLADFVQANLPYTADTPLMNRTEKPIAAETTATAVSQRNRSGSI